MKNKRVAISKRIRFEVFKRDSFKCQYCGSSAPDVVLQIDHIHPVAKGGTGDITNLVTACDVCNSGKSDKVLSDDAATKRRKSQFDQLQERREQLEMMAEWQRGLIDLDEEATRHCLELINSLLVPFSMHLNDDASVPAMRAHVKKFGMVLVMESIRTGFVAYVKRLSDGSLSMDSWKLFWDKLGGICTVKRREQSHPEELELYRIRGYAKKRFSYFLDWEAIKLLRAAKSWDVSIDDLWDAVKSEPTWFKFSDRIVSLIEEAKREQPPEGR